MFDHEAYVKAWGGNKTIIVGGINDDFRLPVLLNTWDWLLMRDVTMGTVNGEPMAYPTYYLALMRDGEQGFETVAHGKIDKTMYGEAGVQELARTMKERHCPDKHKSPGVSTVESVRNALIAKRSSRSEQPKPDLVSATK